MALTKVSFSMVNGAVANVFDFGAIGDGITDDTAAVQDALDSGAGSVYFPEGTYLCAKLNFLASNSVGLTVYGDGRTRSIIKSTSAGDQSINVYAANGANTNNIYIHDLQIDGNNTATTAYIYRCTNVKLENVYVRNHVGKNLHIERAYQVHVSHCMLEVNAANSADCALYLATNGVTVNDECYFQTEQSAPCIIVDDNEFGDCLGVVIENNVFESATFGVQVTPNINTAGININNNYFELVLPNSAIAVSFDGGLHRSVSICGNYITQVAESVRIDAVNSSSAFTVTENSLYRPMMIATSAASTSQMYGQQLPTLNITQQNVNFGNSTYDFDFKPCVIVDTAFPFQTLSVEKTLNDFNTGYNHITASTYKRSNTNASTNITVFSLPTSGGTVYCSAAAGNVSVQWRRYTSATTGTASNQADLHSIKFVTRNTTGGAGAKIVESVSSLNTESSVVTTANMTINGTSNYFALTVVGDATANMVNEWFVDYDFRYLM